MPFLGIATNFILFCQRVGGFGVSEHAAVARWVPKFLDVGLEGLDPTLDVETKA